MTRKKRRAILIGCGLALMGVASTLVLSALQKNVTFFQSPTDVLTNSPEPGTRFRLGGFVEAGTFHKGSGMAATFRLTDCAKSLPVTYIGTDFLPDLFKEGQAAIAEGYLGPDRVFMSDRVLAKHDEKYMPPEVGATLKKGGCWQQVNTNPNLSKPQKPARMQP
jgi:cytochrome c-type biogenesis protein CcmE